MRNVTKLTVSAFKNSQPIRVSNTHVSVNEELTTLCLHGNVIAFKNKDGIFITTAGWNTPTTLERLRGLGANVNIKKGLLYLNGEKWDGNIKQLS